MSTSFYNNTEYTELILSLIYWCLLDASGMAPSELIYGCFNIDCYVSMDMKKCQSRQSSLRGVLEHPEPYRGHAPGICVVL